MPKMKRKMIKPEDIQYTSSGCIIFGIEKLSEDQHEELAGRIDAIFKSYEEYNGKTETTTEDGFLEIYFSLNPFTIDRDEFSVKLSEAVNDLQLADN